MDIQAEKIELIRLITDIHSEAVLIKIKDFLKENEKPAKVESAVMTKRLEGSRQQLKEGKGVKIPLTDIWK